MPRYLEFEVDLPGVEPRVWRRFLLPYNGTFADLHWAIQYACRWEGYHMWVFRDEPRGTGFARPDVEDWYPDPRVPIAERVKLVNFFRRPGDWCEYEYDFGDGWHHRVETKGIVEKPEKFDRRLLDGARAFPPEDCGGLYGYEQSCWIVSAGEEELSELSAEDRRFVEERREWLGEWDPEDFDLEKRRREFDM